MSDPKRPRRRCVVCGQPERTTGGGRCSCGACNWIAVQPSRKKIERAQIAAIERRSPKRRSVEPSSVPSSVAPSFARRVSGERVRGEPILRGPLPRPITESVITESVVEPFLDDPDEAPTLAPVIPILRPAAHKPSGPFVMGSEVGSMTVDDFGGSRLNDLLGGCMRGAIVLIVGAAGHGKSTASAELAAYAAMHWTSLRAGAERTHRCPIIWLDSDQNDPKLVRRCFETAKQAPIFDKRVAMLYARETPWTFDEAIDIVPADTRVLVIDSLEKWGHRKYQAQLDIMIRLRLHPAWLKIVISGTNKAGDVAGLSDIERADDATVFAEKGGPNHWGLRYTKCRWSPSEAFLKRKGPPPSEPDEAEPDEPEHTPPAPVAPIAPVVVAPVAAAPVAPVGAPPPTPLIAAPPIAAPPIAAPLIPATVPGLSDEDVPRTAEPNFDASFLARAARWPLARIGAYRSRLRLLGCHDDSIRDWNAAVRKERDAPIPCDGGDDGPHCGKPAVYLARNKAGHEWYCCSQVHAAHAVGPLVPIKKETAAATNADDPAVVDASDG